MPASPRQISRTSLPPGRDRKMVRHSATISSSEALFTPSAASRCNGAASRSIASTTIPLFFARLRHIGSPMVPTPMNPILSVMQILSRELAEGRLFAAWPQQAQRGRIAAIEDRQLLVERAAAELDPAALDAERAVPAPDVAVGPCTGHAERDVRPLLRIGPATVGAHWNILGNILRGRLRQGRHDWNGEQSCRQQQTTHMTFP